METNGCHEILDNYLVSIFLKYKIFKWIIFNVSFIWRWSKSGSSEDAFGKTSLLVSLWTTFNCNTGWATVRVQIILQCYIEELLFQSKANLFYHKRTSLQHFISPRPHHRRLPASKLFKDSLQLSDGGNSLPFTLLKTAVFICRRIFIKTQQSKPLARRLIRGNTAVWKWSAAAEPRFHAAGRLHQHTYCVFIKADMSVTSLTSHER